MMRVVSSLHWFICIKLVYQSSVNWICTYLTSSWYGREKRRQGDMTHGICINCIKYLALVSLAVFSDCLCHHSLHIGNLNSQKLKFLMYLTRVKGKTNWSPSLLKLTKLFVCFLFCKVHSHSALVQNINCHLPLN